MYFNNEKEDTNIDKEFSNKKKINFKNIDFKNFDFGKFKIPLFIKTATDTNAKEFVAGLHLGDKLIMTGSDIAISQTVAGEDNVLDINYFLALVNENPTIYKDSILIQDKACFISFKVVPNSYIHGCRVKVNDKLKGKSSSKLVFINTSSTGELDK